MKQSPINTLFGLLLCLVLASPYVAQAGVLVRKGPKDPVQPLRVENLTLKLDGSRRPTQALIHLQLSGGEKIEYSVDATLFAVAARKIQDEQLCLLTFSAGRSSEHQSFSECLAIHPSLGSTQLILSTSVLAESLRLLPADGRVFVLTESEWEMSPSAFRNDRDLFSVVGRRGSNQIEDPSLTGRWKGLLNGQQRRALTHLNDFLAVYHLTTAAAEGYLENFPEAEFIDFLTKIASFEPEQSISPEQDTEFETWVRALDHTSPQECARQILFLR